jgi:uncharacterized protein YndB with AHSA1/START domain
MSIAVVQTGKDLTFTQVLDAPRELIFKVFSEPEHVKQWWGPEGWTMPVCTIDFRPGGTWHYCIRNSEGEEHWAKAVYREIVPPARIVYTDNMVDAGGNPIEGLPPKRVTLTFDDLDGKTRLRVHVQLASAADCQKLVDMGFVQHFPETLNHLEQHVDSVKQIVSKLN